MQAFPEQSGNAEMPLQILLFVDKRPSSQERIQQVQDCLNTLRASYPFELQVIDVGEQPYLAEHFRLVATPALIKIHPEPRHTLAGSNLVGQLQHWWSHWQQSVEAHLANLEPLPLDQGKPSPESNRIEKTANVTPISLPVVPSTTGSPEATPASGATSLRDSKIARAAVTPESIHSIARSTEMIKLSDEVFQLKREKEELEHQLKFKDQIIAMLAHDLRNPLTAASLALETLEMGHSATSGWAARLTPTLTAQLLKHARMQTRAIDRMITDILQAAKGTGGELRIDPQTLDLRDLCLDVLEVLQPQFQEKSQQVKTDIPSDLPKVLADGERVRQVLVNLLDNASKYTPLEGTIKVSILHRTTQKVQVSICDTGPGIPEENRERIFEDHFRLKRDEAKAGYGIGLSLCQRIIRAHYGSIWVDSTEHQGSCFHFTLPVFRP